MQRKNNSSAYILKIYIIYFIIIIFEEKKKLFLLFVFENRGLVRANVFISKTKWSLKRIVFGSVWFMVRKPLEKLKNFCRPEFFLLST